MRIFIGKLSILLSIALFLWGGFLSIRRFNPHLLARVNAQKAIPVRPSTVDAMPVAIEIPSINVNLPIIGANITNGIWETTDVGISYILRSPRPGNIGNSILYGHNWPVLLGNLNKVKPGDIITIRFDKSASKTFTVHFITTVEPDDIHILKQTTDSRITLYTCIGLFDSKRLVITAIADTQ